MGKPNDIGRPLNHSERRHRRFSVRYPVQVKFPLGNAISELHAISNNVSLGGILLEAATPIPQHCDVTFTMAVPEHHIVGAVHLAGEGQVIRVESHQSGTGFAIAVKCRRPLSRLEDYFPTSVN